MKIEGLQKLTLLDYPGRTACTIFTYGCNFRCPFCHNASLVTESSAEFLREEEIFSFLQKRRNILDGVCVTGGEPLLQKDIASFLSRIKEIGYAVKLDTNGSFPDKLKLLVEEHLVDYVAMDIKNSPARYAETIGVPVVDLAPIRESVAFLLKDPVDYEFRTTVTRNFHTKADFEEIARWIYGTKRYFLQNFVDSGNLIDSSVTGYSPEEMRQLAEFVKARIPSACLRGL